MRVSSAASWDSDGQRLVLDDPGVYRARLLKLEPQAGERFMVLVMREEEAAKHHHHKHLHGHLLKPTSDYTGYTVTELKADMKARFLPDGMTSTTQMNAEQFREFNDSVEQCIREEYPVECWDGCQNAMALSERRAV